MNQISFSSIFYPFHSVIVVSLTVLQLSLVAFFLSSVAGRMLFLVGVMDENGGGGGGGCCSGINDFHALNCFLTPKAEETHSREKSRVLLMQVAFVTNDLLLLFIAINLVQNCVYVSLCVWVRV